MKSDSVGDVECLDRHSEFVVYGNAPDATPKTFSTFDEAEAAFLAAKRKWPRHRHRLVMRMTIVGETTLMLVNDTRP